jgi:hypothetical protein
MGQTLELVRTDQQTDGSEQVMPDTTFYARWIAEHLRDWWFGQNDLRFSDVHVDYTTDEYDPENYTHKQVAA